MPNRTDFLALGRAVLEIEAEAVQRLRERLDDSFAEACSLLLACKGRTVVLGMGKSGHVGGKIAATLASTGTPAFFVHPGEASHGDLGMITGQDVVLALSNSGETDEILMLLPVIKRRGVPLVALTGRPGSTLAKAADVHLNVSVDKEACPLGLAPTASTTAALAMGDALAVALLEARGFTAEDFALSHPAGALGRRLLLHVEQMMHTGNDIPKVGPDATVSAALLEMSRKRLGMTTIVDADDKLLGIFTDGDLRRTLAKSLDFNATPIKAVMTPGGRSTKATVLAAEAMRLMEQHSINQLVVLDDHGRVVGALNMHDLLKAGVV
ncbi:KpsF/GutQ family sugar-phosphate isomerase [Permianibacter sp. IMCC34836]|uniref:KpsF/GutQ family sugar-phosphate isomerase n=1 Tax=Permianibacter fluminis TaxID=2738515 RepID=UPI001553F70D|nr:KpsF/GutQ family sugar-phosphate isomerase [Permianibacter fluminis]NQD39028.1 KpsF/GutQ family sugar-phosphate isomerase [Permianibacter fluminis]